MLGLWDRSLETLALTLAAVAIALAIGIPIGILAGRSPRVLAAIQPFLDVMQIMPTFAYLAPFALFFLIGARDGGDRDDDLRDRARDPDHRARRAGRRPGDDRGRDLARRHARQLLTKVQLPMARKTIILGINQTIMMALSMVVITALVDAPGLGKNIIHALQQSDVGLAFDAGLAVVIMAVMLDRLDRPRRASGSIGPAAARSARWLAGLPTGPRRPCRRPDRRSVVGSLVASGRASRTIPGCRSGCRSTRGWAGSR